MARRRSYSSHHAPRDEEVLDSVCCRARRESSFDVFWRFFLTRSVRTTLGTPVARRPLHITDRNTVGLCMAPAAYAVLTPLRRGGLAPYALRFQNEKVTFAREFTRESTLPKKEAGKMREKKAVFPRIFNDEPRKKVVLETRFQKSSGFSRGRQSLFQRALEKLETRISPRPLNARKERANSGLVRFGKGRAGGDLRSMLWLGQETGHSAARLLPGACCLPRADS
jgi:hypothetical protein